MNTQTSAALSQQSGAKETTGRYAVISSMAHKWAAGNMDHPAPDRSRLRRKLAMERLEVALEAIAGQLVEPGYPMGSEPELFGRDATPLSEADAQHLVTQYLFHVLDGQFHCVEKTANGVKRWLEGQVGKS